MATKPRPNDACPCGSGRKYKKCHGNPAPDAATPMTPEAAALAAAAQVEAGRRDAAAGRLVEAERKFRHALQLAPQAAGAWRAQGDLAMQAGDFESAQRCYVRLVELRPDDGAAHFALGNALVRRGAFEPARDAYLEATRLLPGLAGAWGNLGNVLKYLGQFTAAIDCYRRGIACEPDPAQRARRHSNLLIMLNYDDRLSHQALFDAHREWAELYARGCAPLEVSRRRPRDDDRRLKVGYLSGSLNGQIVGHFLIGVLAHHDRRAFEIRAYSSTIHTDAFTVRLRAHCDAWVELGHLDDAAAAERIRADTLDLLVDLDGHSPTGRPLIVARKPAPVVIEWLDYFDTMGMEAVDYLLTDPYTTPADSPQRFVEKLLRLPNSRFCYTPPADAPAVAAAPSLARGCVTFGTFNRQDKLHPELLRTWSRILHAVPDARLLIKNRALQSPAVQAVVRDTLARFGVESARVELRGPSPHRALLAEYADIDIALDSFPYNGGLTSCECLWMGVPIVALESQRMIGRQTAAMLRLLGFEDWIAASVDAYVVLAKQKAGDRSGIASVRAELRRRMATSPLCDGRRFAGDLEELYRAVA